MRVNSVTVAEPHSHAADKAMRYSVRYYADKIIFLQSAADADELTETCGKEHLTVNRWTGVERNARGGTDATSETRIKAHFHHDDSIRSGAYVKYKHATWKFDASDRILFG